MKSGIPWEIAEVGPPGRREPGNPDYRELSTGYSRDRQDADGHRRRLGSKDSGAARGDRAKPSAARSAFGAGGLNTEAVDTLRGDLAEVRLILHQAKPRSVIEALQREINQLGEHAGNSRRNGIDAVAVATIERRLTEIRDALCALRPAESLLGVARVIQQLSLKIDIIADAWDPAALEQLEGAVAAIRSVVSQAASEEALAKLSEEVRALGAKLDDARSRADGRILSVIETRLAMLADQLQARDRSGPHVPVELKALIERMIDRIERTQLTSESAAASVRVENLIAKLVVKLDACDARLDRLATVESTLAELLTQIERWHAPTLGGEASPSPAVEALSRHVADLSQADMEIQDSLEAAHGTLAHVVDRLVMIETDMRGKSSHVPDASPPAGTAVAPSAVPAAPQAHLPLEERATSPEQPAIDHYRAEANVLPDRHLESGSGVACEPNPNSSLDRGLPQVAALKPARPPAVEDSGGTSTFIAAARRAAQKENRNGLIQNGAASTEVAPDNHPARRIGKIGSLIGGMTIITVLGVLQVTGFLLLSSDEADLGAQPPTAAISTKDIFLPPMPGPAARAERAGEDQRSFPVLSPARRPLGLFRTIDGAVITTPSPGPVMPGWTLEQLLEAQMSPERWDNATGGLAPAIVAPGRRKLPVVRSAVDPGPSRRTQ